LVTVKYNQIIDGCCIYRMRFKLSTPFSFK
jgi:hypothetical protein